MAKPSAKSRYRIGLPLVVLLPLLLPACAVVYDDADGTRHMWGIGHLYYRTPETPGSATVTGVETVGLGISGTQENIGLNLGWHSQRKVEVPNATAIDVTCLSGCALSDMDARPLSPSSREPAQ